MSNNSPWTFIQPQYEERTESSAQGPIKHKDWYGVWHDLINNTISGLKPVNSKISRATSEATNLKEDELIVFLEVKN